MYWIEENSLSGCTCAYNLDLCIASGCEELNCLILYDRVKPGVPKICTQSHNVTRDVKHIGDFFFFFRNENRMIRFVE